MTLKRHPGGPILTRADIPAMPPEIVDPSAVFNAGAVFWRGRYRLMLRVQTRGRRSYLVMAAGDDGVRFEPARDFIRLRGIEKLAETVYHVYDPRLTILDGRCYAMLAVDLSGGGCELGLAVSDDDALADWEFLGLVSNGDFRNGVLFPEKIGGRYLRLDRPNRQARHLAEGNGAGGGDEIWLAESVDLLAWRPLKLVAAGRPHYWDELIGPGPPPVKTREGWLQLYHGVATHFATSNIYQVGALLLDLEDPACVLGRSRDNILEPRESWELTGQVPNVVFPAGMIVDIVDEQGFAEDDSRVLVYYGAADTCLGLAVGTIRGLLGSLE